MKIEIKKKIILVANKPTENGTIYPTECIDAIIKQSKTRTIFGKVGNSADIKAEEIAFKVTGFKRDKNSLVADIEIVNTQAGIQLKDLLRGGLKRSYRPIGFGTINKKSKIVTDYSIDFIVADNPNTCDWPEGG